VEPTDVYGRDAAANQEELLADGHAERLDRARVPARMMNTMTHQRVPLFHDGSSTTQHTAANATTTVIGCSLKAGSNPRAPMQQDVTQRKENVVQNKAGEHVNSKARQVSVDQENGPEDAPSEGTKRRTQTEARGRPTQPEAPT